MTTYYRLLAFFCTYAAGIFTCFAMRGHFDWACIFGGATPVVAWMMGLFMRSPQDADPQVVIAGNVEVVDKQALDIVPLAAPSSKRP